MVGTLDENALIDEYFTASRFCYYDDLTWCVQEKQPIPIWLNFYILTGNSMVWIVAFPTFAIVTFIFYYLQQFEDVQPKWQSFRIALGVLCRFIGMSYPYNSTNNSSRILFIIGMLGCLIFSTSFMSILMTSMNEQRYEDQVKTIQEICDKEYELTGSHYSLRQVEKANRVVL